MSSGAPSDSSPWPADAAAAGLNRLPPPPRRLSGRQTLKLLEAGTPGRPLLRPLAMALLAGVLAGTMAAPDVLCALYPTYDMKVVSATPATLPGPLASLSAAVPTALLGYAASYRLPSGEIQDGAISEAEFLAISGGRDELRVHAGGGGSRPASGLMGGPRLVLVGMFAAVAGVFLVLAAARVKRRWWLVRLYRKGAETIGRVTELHSDRLVLADRPVGRLYTLYYAFPTSSDDNVEGNVRDFHTTRFHPLAVERPVRILFLGEQRPISLPTDLLPSSLRQG